MVGRPPPHLDDHVMHVEACAAAADQKADIALKLDVLRLAPRQGGICQAHPPFSLVRSSFSLACHHRMPLLVTEQSLLVDRDHRAHELKPTLWCDSQGIDF